MKPQLIKFLGWLVTSAVLLTCYNLAVHFAGLHPGFWVNFVVGVAVGVVGLFVGTVAATWVYRRRMQKVIDRQAARDA
jgi:ABC-type spermidine/putrescine transport system permease subunit II